MKLIDPMGEMVTPTWEDYATQLANAEEEDLLTALKDIIAKEEVNMSQEANVFVGKDTRYRIGPNTLLHLQLKDLFLPYLLNEYNYKQVFQVYRDVRYYLCHCVQEQQWQTFTSSTRGGVCSRRSQ